MKAKVIFLSLALLAMQQSFAQSPWPQITQQSRPWTRWWWMGSAVDEPNISRLLTDYRQAGFGGVEITPIYGAIGYENRYIDFLTPKWVSMLNFSVKKATQLGMGVDMNTGTGWPFGGPQITPEFAASKLTTRTYDVNGGQPFTQKIGIDKPGIAGYVPTLQSLVAYGDDGRKIDLLRSGKLDADGTLRWNEPGHWQLVAAFLDKTGQVVKRSAPGGAGYTMDHLYRPALQTYLTRFDEALGASPGVRCFFNDSYEVYNADLSPGLFDEFRRRRGYDVRDYIRELTGGTSNDSIARIRADYRETMSDMILENFTLPWTNWIHGKHARSRNQAHGSPGNVLDLYGAVDIPETETFGLTRFPIPGLNFYTNDTRNVPPDALMLKFGSSAAHVTGKNLASSETFTWLGEHFTVPLSHCKAEVEQVFLAGVNHVFYHGTAYSPQDAPWPGWQFYASVEFNPANSFWPHLKGLNAYITRCQSVLQAGKADNELLVYWPVYDAWNDAPAKLDMQLGVHTVDQWLQPTDFYKTSKVLMDAGYSVDFISDRQIARSMTASGKILPVNTATPYKVLIIPKCRLMSVETVENALRLARNGATVIFQELPHDVPGFHDVEKRRRQLSTLLKTIAFGDMAGGVRSAVAGKGRVLLAADVASALAAAQVDREQLADAGIKFIRRKNGTATWYYLVNHTATAIDRSVALNAAGKPTILDPLTGDYGKVNGTVRGGKTRIRVQLAPGQALFVKIDAKPQTAVAWNYSGTPDATIDIPSAATLKFTAGGPALPQSRQLNRLTSWTALGDPQADNFSGTGVYTFSFNLPAKKTGEYVLDLGDVRETAQVTVNGRDAGILWSVPYRRAIGSLLKPGKNTLVVSVTNLMANRIRDLDVRKVEWRKYHEINFVNLNYQPFDASGWALQPSGLLSPLKIEHYSLNE